MKSVSLTMMGAEQRAENTLLALSTYFSRKCVWQRRLGLFLHNSQPPKLHPRFLRETSAFGKVWQHLV
jgi:hypothetical protein